MKNFIFTLIAVMGITVMSQVTAQDVKTIKLEQTEGEFNKKKLKLKSGTTYQFEVTNKDVDHEVGFVIAPAGKTDQANHIQAAYLSKTIDNGMTATSGEVTLPPGEYVYFCPLNPTPEYKITVK